MSDYYLKQVAPIPANEPVTVEMVKRQVRLAQTEGAFDEELKLLIAAARRWAENFTSRCLIEQTWDMLFAEGFPWLEGAHYIVDPHEIRIPRAPLKVSTGITHVKYLDTNGTQQTLIAGTDYNLIDRGEPAVIVPAYSKSWPSTRDWTNSSGQYPVEVRFIAGYGADASAIPQNFQNALLLHVEAGFERDPDIQELLLARAEALLWQERFFPR